MRTPTPLAGVLFALLVALPAGGAVAQAPPPAAAPPTQQSAQQGPPPATTAPFENLGPTTSAEGVSRSALAHRVDQSIGRGVRYLLARQNPDGSWGEQAPARRPGDDGLWGPGQTALATLALLNAGESHQSPAIQKAVKWLKRSKPGATYAVALRACVYASLPESMRDRELRGDLNWLQRNQIARGEYEGLYSYYAGGSGSRADYSNAQYGVLGAWYAANAGLEIPLAYWRRAEKGWLSGQNEDGGWGYHPRWPPSYGSMTAAAAATLYITHDFLHAGESSDLNQLRRNKPLEGAMDWLAKNFAVNLNPGLDARPARAGDDDPLGAIFGRRPELANNEGASWVHYMLFSYERVGEASGLTRFGSHKWYDLGADHLVATQAYDGSWEGDRRATVLVNTSYALLFLSRGRAPVAIQKLQYDGRWNNRSRDAANFVRFLRRASERHMNWQIVSADATPEELREAPILYLSGDRTFTLTDEQKAKLGAYLATGGLILAANEGPRDDFARGVTALAKELLPDYAFRELPKDHAVYTANFPTIGFSEPIRGLSNGVRELIVLIPSGDVSWRWQSNGGAATLKQSPYAIPANLWLYATDKANPRFKGEDTWVERDTAAAPAPRAARVARLRHGGNWNPEPAGWVRLANLLHNAQEIELTTQAVDPASGLDPSFTLAHLTSASSFTLTPEQQAGLKRYLDSGGLLLFDAAGGVPERAADVETLLAQLYPGAQPLTLPPDHAIFAGQSAGARPIQSVAYRRGNARPDSHLPRLRGVTVDGRLLAILSEEDLSAALVGYQTAGITGYTPRSAAEVVRNLLAWRLQQAGK